MSELSIDLAIIGVLLLLGVALHGYWNSRRNRPRQAVDDSPPPSAAPAEKIEPMLDPGPLRAPLPLDDESVAGAAAPALEPVLAPPPPPRRGQLDALIDVIVPITLEAPVSGDAALAALPPTRRAGAKPMAFEGLSEADGQWEAPRPGARYGAMQAGVQLANRGGALNEIEFSEFVVQAQAYADAVGGAPDFPEMRGEVARARELDQFAGAHDARIAFCIRARRTAWSPGYVQQHAAKLGFAPGMMAGRLVLPASEAGAPPQLVLNFDTRAALADDPSQAALHELTLSFDVPQTPREQQPFERLRELAFALAVAMDGEVTDDRGAAIVLTSLDAIAADLDKLYDALDARELSAGSALARRLFS